SCERKSSRIFQVRERNMAADLSRYLGITQIGYRSIDLNVGLRRDNRGVLKLYTIALDGDWQGERRPYRRVASGDDIKRLKRNLPAVTLLRHAVGKIRLQMIAPNIEGLTRRGERNCCILQFETPDCQVNHRLQGRLVRTRDFFGRRNIGPPVG